MRFLFLLIALLIVPTFAQKSSSEIRSPAAYHAPLIENFDTLRDIVDKIDRRALSEKRPVTIPLVKEILP